jgi:hypothetical protein
MHSIAAWNARQPLHTERIPLQPEEQSNTMWAAARLLQLTVNLKAGEQVQRKNDAPPIVDHLLLHLEWVARLPILFRETLN